MPQRNLMPPLRERELVSRQIQGVLNQLQESIKPQLEELPPEDQRCLRIYMIQEAIRSHTQLSRKLLEYQIEIDALSANLEIILEATREIDDRTRYSGEVNIGDTKISIEKRRKILSIIELIWRENS